MSVLLKPRLWALVAAFAMALALPAPASAAHPYLTSEAPFITLDPGVPAGSMVKAIINSGETYHDFLFEGIPDGIGLKPGRGHNTVDVYVSHEQSRVPFRNQADFEDASVSKLTLSTAPGPNFGAVLSAEVAIPASAGYIRFCSSFMAGPREGFAKWTFFANEESNDVISVPAGAPYGADPSVAPDRQAGYVVALDTRNGQFRQIAGMGRHNHENTIVVPGGWKHQMAMLSTDDTFNAPSSQLYLYLAKNARDVWKDRGDLWAFRATGVDGVPLTDATDPFNGANDYLDIQPGEDFQGEFIQVPDPIADGTTGDPPQQALEDWSNDNNVFQFIRLEDLAYDRNDPRTVYAADTGATRVVADSTTGRMVRAPLGTPGFADNGRIFKFVFNEDDPTKVDHLTVFADGDAPASSVYVPFVSPDNMDTSATSMMVQEDTDDAKIWWYDFGSNLWSVVATVNDPAGESSGIVDASDFLGDGWWVLDVQAHGSNESEKLIDGVLFKREDGQLLLMRIPGS